MTTCLRISLIALGVLASLAASVSAIAQQAAAASVPVASAPAASAPPPAARGPALDLALEAAQAAVQACSARQQRIGVAVVDSAGVVKVLLAADGASSRGVQSGNNKAVTALTFRAPTSELGRQAQTDTALAAKLAANTAFNSRAGGVPIKVGNELIGAIGVGGARGSEVDEACALAGLERVRARLL
jgi:uncharacterized protein GlcG (DUF336 family)